MRNARRSATGGAYLRAMECRVFWGSHRCVRGRGHGGLHECDCCEHDSLQAHVAAEGVVRDAEGEFPCAASWPYLGPDTVFTGADAPAEHA